jgi:hypothetical protein
MTEYVYITTTVAREAAEKAVGAAPRGRPRAGTEACPYKTKWHRCPIPVPFAAFSLAFYMGLMLDCFAMKHSTRDAVFILQS